jgi:RND family efflux transporter MFP subunit
LSPHEPSGNNNHFDAPPALRDTALLVAEPSHSERSHVPVRTTQGTGLRIALVIGAIALLLVIGFIYRHHANSVAAMELRSQTAQNADAPPPVDVVRVSSSSPIHALVLPGEVQAWNQTAIYARVSGYIDSWHADIGDRVKKGQVLALIDTPELDDQLKAAEAKLNAEKSGVAVAQANEAFAESTYNRWKDSEKGVVSEQEREEKKAEYLSAVAKLKAAQSQVELDQADVNRLVDLTNFKKVEAPYDGVITGRHIDIGDLVSAGSGTGNTLLYNIAQADQMRVYVDVPQAASMEVKDGIEAQVTVEGLPKVFVGPVSRNSASLDSEAKTLRVEVDVKNPDLLLKPQMYVEVSFKTTESHPPLQIPASALSFRSSGPQVAVVGQQGIIHFRPVTIAQDMGKYVEIGSGLADGDLVGLNISNQIADGDKVEPVLQQEKSAESSSPAPHVSQGEHSAG